MSPGKTPSPKVVTRTKIVHKGNLAAFLSSGLLESYCGCQDEHELHHPTPAETRRSMRKSFSEGRTREVAMVISRSAGPREEVVARCEVWTDPWNFATIESVVVRADRRGEGLCKRLVSDTRRYLEEQTDVRLVRVYTFKDNPAACACYRSVFGEPVHETRTSLAWVGLRPHTSRP
jgi:ribosomal protein S18 acetylase RimI-like enzyme